MDDELYLDEVVEVVALFRRGNGQEVTIRRVGLGFEHQRGARTMHIFDVTDEQADYRLEFDSITLVWRLPREADHVS